MGRVIIHTNSHPKKKTERNNNPWSCVSRVTAVFAKPLLAAAIAATLDKRGMKTKEGGGTN